MIIRIKCLEGRFPPSPLNHVEVKPCWIGGSKSTDLSWSANFLIIKVFLLNTSYTDLPSEHFWSGLNLEGVNIVKRGWPKSEKDQFFGQHWWKKINFCRRRLRKFCLRLFLIVFINFCCHKWHNMVFICHKNAIKVL